MARYLVLFTFMSVFVLLFAAEPERILCYGDSITHKGRWVAEVGSHPGIEMINAGRSGRRASQALDQLKPYLEKHKKLDRIILFLGVNDLPARDPRPGDVKVDACVKNMSAAIDLALKHVKKAKDLILIAPCTVNPDTMNEVNKKKGYHICGPLLASMEKKYQALAKEKGISFLSLLNVVSKENFKDGLHPNAAGDKEIAQVIAVFLSK